MFKIVRKKRSAPVVRVPPQEPAPEVVKQVEEEFDDPKFDEDAAEKREHFERVVAAPPARVFEVFVQFVWRQNAGVTAVEILKDSKDPNQLEVGMVRRLAGYEEEIIAVKKNAMVEYRLLDGMPTSYHKSRILFRNEEDGTKTRVIWTIWWSPTSFAAGLLYTLMMKGFCNLALYRLDQAVITGTVEVDEAPSETASDANDSVYGGEDLLKTLSAVSLDSGEKPKLQWAARLMTGYEGNLTPDQQKALEDLRILLQKSDPEAWELCQKHPDGPDRIMLRFLRAECSGKQRKFHVEKSKKRLCETLRFRRDIKADELINRDAPKLDMFMKTGNELIIKDKEGRVTVFTRVGLLSICMDTKIMTELEWKTNLVCITERRMQMLRESSKEFGHEVSAQVCIYDVRGVGLSSRKIIPFTKMINDVASKHYPELVDIIIIAFAPALFTSIFSTIKTFLDPVTASKVKVFGTSKHEMEKMRTTLRAIIDPAVLPREYGGDSDVEVGYPSEYKGEKYPIYFT